MLTEKQKAKVEEYLPLVERALACAPHDARSIERNPEDLVQEGCLKLCALAASNAARKKNFEDYAFVAVRNKMLDQCRRAKRVEGRLISADGEEGAAPFEWTPSPVDFAEETANKMILSEALSALGEAKRGCGGVLLKGMDALTLQINGYSVTDVAAREGVRANHVGAWTSKAKRYLRGDADFLAKLSRLGVEKRAGKSYYHMEPVI
jgi:RNA polymerase sigma factor (sigma-70 family)